MAVIDKQGGQYINWTFTLNNYTEAEVVLLKSLVLTNQVKYIIFGYEVGENGTPHLQGYVELLKRIRLTGLKKIMPARGHYSARLGTQQQAIDYCRKGEQSKKEWDELKTKGPNFGKNAKVIELGVKQTQAGSTLSEKDNLVQERLISMREKIKNGITEKDLYDEEPLMCARFPKYVSKCLSWRKPAIRDNLKVELHVGPTLSGKTHQAFARFPNLYNMPVKSGNTLWFPGYAGEQVVLLDDFKGGFTLDQFLRLTDKYPIQVEDKGGFNWFSPSLIIITSNFEEIHWYDYVKRQEHYLALKRRITLRFKWNNRVSVECDDSWEPKPQPAIIDSISSTESDDDVVLSQIDFADSPPTRNTVVYETDEESEDLLKL